MTAKKTHAETHEKPPIVPNLEAKDRQMLVDRRHNPRFSATLIEPITVELSLNCDQTLYGKLYDICQQGLRIEIAGDTEQFFYAGDNIACNIIYQFEDEQIDATIVIKWCCYETVFEHTYVAAEFVSMEPASKTILDKLIARLQHN